MGAGIGLGVGGLGQQDGDQGEWWAAWQSTLLPIIVYYRDNSGVVWAESRVYISADLEVCVWCYCKLEHSLMLRRPERQHSNEFWKYCARDTIKHYTELLGALGRELEVVHLWSDGCGAQFKQKVCSERFGFLSLLSQKPSLHRASAGFSLSWDAAASTSRTRISRVATARARRTPRWGLGCVESSVE